MGQTSHAFTPEFKLEAVRLAQANGTTKTARDLGNNDTVLGRGSVKPGPRRLRAAPPSPAAAPPP